MFSNRNAAMLSRQSFLALALAALGGKPEPKRRAYQIGPGRASSCPPHHKVARSKYMPHIGKRERDRRLIAFTSMS